MIASSLAILAVVVIVAVIIIAVVATACALLNTERYTDPQTPLDEFCGGAEALDEIHTLFDGIYARFNGLGPWEAPSDLPESELAVWERERRYAKLGWLVTDLAMRGWAATIGRLRGALSQ